MRKLVIAIIFTLAVSFAGTGVWADPYTVPMGSDSYDDGSGDPSVNTLGILASQYIKKLRGTVPREQLGQDRLGLRPLVLKMDNGSPFRSDDTETFLDQAGVFGLFSPPELWKSRARMRR